METHIEFTRGIIRNSGDLHIIELIREIGLIDRPLTMRYVDDLLQRMVISGSSPDCLIHGVPQALVSVERVIGLEAGRRFAELISKMRVEEKPPVWPYETHAVNFPTDHFEKRFGKVN